MLDVPEISRDVWIREQLKAYLRKRVERVIRKIGRGGDLDSLLMMNDKALEDYFGNGTMVVVLRAAITNKRHEEFSKLKTKFWVSVRTGVEDAKKAEIRRQDTLHHETTKKIPKYNPGHYYFNFLGLVSLAVGVGCTVISLTGLDFTKGCLFFLAVLLAPLYAWIHFYWRLDVELNELVEVKKK